MDFCLRVTDFSAAIVYIYAACFASPAERTLHVMAAQMDRKEFLAVNYDRAGLITAYRDTLGLPVERVRCVRACRLYTVERLNISTQLR